MATAAPIDPGCFYNAEMLNAAGFGIKTLQKWRRTGMKVKYVGRSLWVHGSEIARMIEELGGNERWDTSAKTD